MFGNHRSLLARNIDPLLVLGVKWGVVYLGVFLCFTKTIVILIIINIITIIIIIVIINIAVVTFLSPPSPLSAPSSLFYLHHHHHHHHRRRPSSSSSSSSAAKSMLKQAASIHLSLFAPLLDSSKARPPLAPKYFFVSISYGYLTIYIKTDKQIKKISGISCKSFPCRGTFCWWWLSCFAFVLFGFVLLCFALFQLNSF